MPGWMTLKLETRLLGEISVTSDMQMTPPLWQKTNRKERVSLINVKEVSEKAGLKLNKNEDHGIWSHHFMANSWGNNGNSERLYFERSKITVDSDCSCEIKRCLLLGRKAMTNLDSILKSQDKYFTDKRPYNQNYGFSSSHV